MKTSIVGMGSIGKRHYDNLIKLGVSAKGSDIGKKPDFDVDFAVIATPTDTHLEIAKQFEDYRVPVFVEKPVTMDLESAKFYESYDWFVPNMVACNLRFTDAVGKIKESFPDPDHIHATVMNNNDPKYGDLILEDIHEFDYLSYLFGEPERIEILRHNDRLYDAAIYHKDGFFSTVHGNRNTIRYIRQVEFEHARYDIDVDNKMYVRQMNYFINCIKDGVVPMNGIKEASKLTRILLEAINRHDNPSA